MTFARPLFFLLVTAGLAIPALAEDDATQSPSSPAGSLQSQAGDVFQTGALRQTLQMSSGLFFLKERPRFSLHRLNPPTFSTPNDGVCYTMRTYKVKRAERLSDYENGSRGYSTCEMASNYQVRSALAHEHTSAESSTNQQQK